MSTRRVVITGIGTINPLGKNAAETWEKVKNGVSGIDTISKFDAAGYSSRVAGEVKDFDFRPYFDEETIKTAKRLEPFVHYAVAALKEALAGSKLDIEGEPERVGICIGSGIGGIHSAFDNSSALVTKGVTFFILNLALTASLSNSLYENVMEKYELREAEKKAKEEDSKATSWKEIKTKEFIEDRHKRYRRTLKDILKPWEY